jgi:FAD/FMN-containing dehydrogenase
MNDLRFACLSGDVVAIEHAAIERLGDRLAGVLVLPGSAAYDGARKVWNGMIDRRPAAIVRCASADDVVEAVGFARERELLASVRGGGHNIAGAAVADRTLMIDLSGMKEIRVDARRRTAFAEAGLRLGDFDAATQALGLATTLGLNSDTGIAGLTLGGGLGRLARKHGLACDNLLAAEVVLADGRRLTASAEKHADLFWGLRGGGGNFGIVTGFRYALHPLGPTVLGGVVLWDFARAGEVLRFYRDFARGAPDEVSADVVFLTADGQKMLAVSATYAGPVEDGERALRPLRQYGPPAVDQIAPVGYGELQASADGFFTPGRRYYWKAQFLAGISDAAIETLVAAYAAVPSPSCLLVLQHLGGAVARVPADETAYANRDAAFDCFPVAAWDDAAEDERHIAWVRRWWEAMRPHGTGGVYVNNLGEEGQERVRAAYGVNYDRLAALKARYDPANLFRLNQNIRPR